MRLIQMKIDLLEGIISKPKDIVYSLESNIPKLKEAKTEVKENEILISFKSSETIKEQKITQFKEKYAKVFRGLTIDTTGIDKDSEKIKEISKKDYFLILNKFMKEINYAQLETLITNAILNDFTEKNIEIEERFFKLKELLTNKPIFLDELYQLFEIIDTPDKIVLKLLFYVILKDLNPKDLSKTLEEIENIYSTVKDIKPNLIDRETLLRDNAWEIAVLECFFKNYILLESKTQKVKEQYEVDKNRIRDRIPINIKEYRFEQFKTEISDIIKNVFSNKKELVLETYTRVLKSEFNRIEKLDLYKILVSYSYSEEDLEQLKKKGIFYDKLNDLFINSGIRMTNLNYKEKEEKKKVIKAYAILEGFYKAFRTSDISWDRRFQLSDIEANEIECVIKENRQFFTDLKNAETKIQIQGFLSYECYYNDDKKQYYTKEKWFDIIDLEILDNFEEISVDWGTLVNGKRELKNTRNGVILFTYPKNKNVFHDPLMRVPIIYKNRYMNWDENSKKMYFEVKIGPETICMTIDEIYEYIISETRLWIKGGPILKEAINSIIGEYENRDLRKPFPMYNACGVFLSPEKELEIAHPFNENIKIIGTNDLQRGLIEDTKRKGIDKNGDLTQAFYDILCMDTIPLNALIGLYGYAVIEPFFHAMSKNLDVFPDLFCIGIPSTGKSTMVKLLLCKLYGTRYLLKDNVNSEARFTKFPTRSTFPTAIDDFDELKDEIMAFIKAASTDKEFTRDRLTNKNRLESERLYSSYSGTANKKEFLKKDEAFRARCYIFEFSKKITSIESQERFISILRQIDDGKIYGYYLLEKVLELLEKEIPGKMSKFMKLIKLYETTRERIINALKANEAVPKDLRRITLYTLIYMGWKFWYYTFQTKNLNSEKLKDALNLESKIFINFVKEQEEQEVEISLESIDSILEFYNRNKEKYAIKESPGKITVLQTNFVADYDQWASSRKYPALNTLTALGDIQSKILNRKVKPDTMWVANINDSKKRRERALEFYFEDICKLRGISESPTENNEKIDLDQYLIEGNGKDQINLIERLKEIFEENNYNFLKKQNIIQMLQVEKFSKDFIEEILNQLLRENNLIEKDGFIQMKQKK